jgi:phospholipase/lecithinase/hemolysin
LHTDAFWLGGSANEKFYSNFSLRISSSGQTLLNTGAPYVFVADIYPKNLAQLHPKYACVTTLGEIIQNANAALSTSLKEFGSKVIYYDVYGFMTGLLDKCDSGGV